uniref:Phosphoinositide phospholipase C n=1 Tax=Gadus morhua TaxID=8049 RepID=A0A8C5AZM7_GADMO
MYLHGDDNLGSMLVGTVMRKVKSRTWKKQRYFKLQEDCMTIWYNSLIYPISHIHPLTNTFNHSHTHSPTHSHIHSPIHPPNHTFIHPPIHTFIHPFTHPFTHSFTHSPTHSHIHSPIHPPIHTFIHPFKHPLPPLSLTAARRWIGDWFKKADKNKDGRMNFKETQDLLRMMNVDMNEQHCHSLFTMADRSQTGTLLDEEFVLFYKMLTKRDDVMRVFQDFSGDGQKLSAADLEDFLREEQLEAEDAAGHAARIIETYEPSDAAKQLNAVTFDGFLMYLGSAEGSIQDPRWCGLFQDLDQPLCHYFISSSHNTYLMEDQLRGQSSVEGYIRALTRGCRCVEVDCWDGPNGEPIVYHGHTFTSKILFRDVVQAVDKYAFKASDYPVILSIENHCSVEQQRTMAQHLNHILGDALLRSPLEGKGLTGLPSPEELKGKILLKAKKIGGLEERVGGLTEDPLTGEVSDEDEAAEIDNEHSHRETFRRKTKVVYLDPCQPLTACPVPHRGGVSMQKSKQHLSKELSDCVVYCKSVHFSGFKHSRLHQKFYEVSSFTESKARKQLRDAGGEFVLHNSRQLSRVYPSGFRTDSSNFSPQEMWNAGCQIVALNFQTAGEAMDLNDGLFRQNGGCGYILKPSFMRQPGGGFNPEAPQNRESYLPQVLHIQVISGQQLPKVNIKEGSIVDPLVRVEIHGVPLDQGKQETRYIENNGFNPVWYDTLRFTIHTPELALVRFLVEDYDKTSRNDFVGQYTLPFCSLQQGYRHIHLLSRDGTRIPPASLFVHVRITELA